MNIKKENIHFKFFFFTFQNLENSQMLQTTTLKRNLVPEIRRKARKRVGSGMWLGGLPPLKETFVGSTLSWVMLGSSILGMTWHQIVFCTICVFYLHCQ